MKKGGKFLADKGIESVGIQDPRSDIEKFGMMRAKYYRDLVGAGQINPDDAANRLRAEVAQRSMAVGIMNEQQGLMMMGQRQPE